MFVFGEVQDPHQETVNLVEDIVRSQIIELVRLYSVHIPQLNLTGLSTLFLDHTSSRAGNASWSPLSDIGGSYFPHSP